MLTGRAEQLAKGLTSVGVPCVQRVGSLLGIFFSDVPVTDYESAQAAAAGYPRFFHAMLDRGVALAPGAYEAVFLSLAHSYDDIDRTVDIASAAVAA
jgi:glutamate-1-semialdehyde 2,1-aminomutase